MNTQNPPSAGNTPSDQSDQSDHIDHNDHNDANGRVEGGGRRPVRLAGLAADAYGVDDARAPLVLLHGLTFNRSMWRPAAQELQRLDPGRRVVALDLPGHGRSPAQPSYAGEDVLPRIHEAVVAAGLAAPVVVGHSAAGITATAYAAAYPSRGVVNVDAAPQPGVPIAVTLKSLADRLDAASFPAVWDMFQRSMRIDLLPRSARRLLQANQTVDRDLVVGHWQELLTRTSAEIDAWLGSTLGALRASRLRYSLVMGSPLAPEDVVWLMRILPGIAIQMWDGSGHFPHLAHPQRFALLLRDTADWPRAAAEGSLRIA